MKTPDEIRNRLGEAARNWRKFREERGTEGWEYAQAEHWFYCLCWVAGFERYQGEAIGTYIDRAAALR